MQKITPHLWFDMNCEEAINFYVSVFKDSKIVHLQQYPTGVDDPHMKGMEGKILQGVFELGGQRFQALDGGPIFKFTPANAFMVNFDPSQNPNAAADLESLWGKLSEGGTVRMPKQEYPFSKLYGWIQDKYGVNWQLILTDPEGEPRPHIIPSLMFTKEVSGKALEAANFYVSIFKQSKVGTVAKYPDGMPGGVQDGVMFEEFLLDGTWFTAMDAGPEHNFRFNEAVAFIVECDDQAELDRFWAALSSVPESEQCGWCKDKYGLSWQIIPKRLVELMTAGGSEKSNKVLSALMKMKKLDIAELEAAYSS